MIHFIILLNLIFYIDANFEAKSYQLNDKIAMYVNKVGPYYNPHETYIYYTLPVCRPEKIIFRQLSLGEVLDGDRLVESLYDIHFRQNVNREVLCNLVLSNEDIKKLIHAIEELYYFEFVLDQNVPVRGFIGNLEESKMLPHSHKALFYTHHNFQIQYNKNNIIYGAVYTTQADPIDLIPLADKKVLNVTFTYSVNWMFTNVVASQRNEVILKNNLFPRVLEIHWISITNNLVLVLLLLTFILFIISRVLRRDFARYNRQTQKDGTTTVVDISEEEDQEERGWKIVHNDVFRPPQCGRFLFCAVIGTGTQLLAIAIGLVILALLGVFKVQNHGGINTAALFLYSLTSWVAGFVSTRLLRVLENTHPVGVSAFVYGSKGNGLSSYNWVRVVNVTCAMFTGPLVIVWMICNSVSFFYGTTHSMPLTTILLLGAVWVLVGYPLTVAGGMLGRRTELRLDTSGCRVRNIPREIPSTPWYKSRWIYFSLAGLLPFSSVCIELYYIFSTVWGREHYSLYGVLLIVFGILIVVTICVAVSLVYFQLVMEDYRWWWGSLQLGLSTATFIMVYSVFHYYYRSKMRGLLQTVEYFAYSVLVCYGFFLAISAIAFFSSIVFIRFIYRNIKLD